MSIIDKIKAERLLIEAHKTTPCFARNGLSWVRFDGAAKAFAAAQSLPQEPGTAEGLPSGWLSDFVACAAFVGASDGAEPRRRRIPTWLPQDMKKICYTKTELPDGRAARVAFGDNNYAILQAFNGELILFLWTVGDAVRVAQKTLERAVIVPNSQIVPIGNGWVRHESYRPARETFPYAMPESIVQDAKRVAHYINTAEDTAVWLAGQTLMRRLLPGFSEFYCPPVHSCDWFDMPVECRQDMIDFGFFEKYGHESCPIGRIDGDRYYFWISTDNGGYAPHYLVVNEDVHNRAGLWRRNVSVTIPEGIDTSEFDNRILATDDMG